MCACLKDSVVQMHAFFNSGELQILISGSKGSGVWFCVGCVSCGASFGFCSLNFALVLSWLI